MKEEFEISNDSISSPKEQRIPSTKMSEENSSYNKEYEWKAPERITGTHDKKFYLAGSSISLFVVVFSLLTDNLLLVVAVVALVILVYALDSVPPRIVKHELTNKGLVLFSTLYTWKFIKSFWFSQRSGNYYLNVEIKKGDDFTELMIMPLGEGNIEKITSYVSQFVEYLPEDEINNSLFRRVVDGRILSFKEILERNTPAN